MRFGKLGLGFNLDDAAAEVIPAEAPTDIAWSGSHTVPENSALGTVVGGVLTATHERPENIVFTVVGDAASLFGTEDNTVIVTGIPDYETATSHDVTIRAAEGAEYYDEIFPVTVSDVSETPAEEPPPDGEIIVDDPAGYDHPPVVVEIDQGIAFHGKKKTGASGKFIYDMGLPASGRTYTVEYDPDWSLLENGGVTAMFGFGFRQGNDFHLVGLKGNGASGLNTYIVSGDNKWNQTTGFDVTNGGAAAFGTQGGPNWIQMEISLDMTEYTFRTSSDGVAWTDEFTDQVPDPFTDMTNLGNFGLAAFLEAADAGPFRIDVTVWIGDVAPSGIFISRNYAYETATAGTLVGTLTTQGGTPAFTYTMEN